MDEWACKTEATAGAFMQKVFLPRNLWFPAEKPMVSRQETFKTHVALFSPWKGSKEIKTLGHLDN